MALTKITNSAIADDIGLGGNPTTSTQTAGDSTTRIATTAFVSTAVANLVDSAPATLNTLNELAAAIGDNATFSSTMTTSIASKLPLAGGTLTGGLTGTTGTFSGALSSGAITSSGDVSAIETGHAKVVSNSVGDYFPSLEIKRTSGSSKTDKHWMFQIGSTGHLHVKDITNNTNALVLRENGDVYIGADSSALNPIINVDVSASSATFAGNIGVSGTVDGIDIAARDAILTSTTTTAGAALPKAGGTMTGGLIVQAATGQLRLQGTSNTNKNVSIFYNESGDYGQINVDESGVNQKDLWITGLNLKFGRSTSSESMRIKSDGNVGIGTDDPDARLGIKSSGASTYPLLIKSSDNQQLFRFREESDTRGTFYINDASENSKVTLASSGNSSFMGGNVGIGTAAPADRLHVALDSSTTNAEVEVMRVEATSSGTPAVGFGPFIDFRGDRINGGPDSYGRLGFEADAMPSTTVDGAFVVQTAEDGTYSERLRITSDGNVGIGTATPDSPLEISGADDTRLKLTDTGDSSELMLRSDGANTQIYTNTAHDLGIYTSGNVGQLHLKQSNGNVGIGTAAPDAKFEVEWTGTHASTDSIARITAPVYPSLEFYSTNTNTSNRNWKISSVYDSYGTLEFLRSSAANGVPNVATLSMNKEGNVGIGTSAPFSLDGNAAPGLTIKSNGPYILLQDANNSDKVRYISNNTGALQFGIVGDNGASGKTEHMRILNGGNVGIGTDTPTAPLHVFKGESGAPAPLADSVLILENNTHNYLQFLTPSSSESGLIFGDVENDNTAGITYNHSTDNITITAADDIVLSADTVIVGNNKPVWSGSYGGALFLKGNNATAARHAELTIVNSAGASTGTGLVVDNDLQVGIGTDTPAHPFHITKELAGYQAYFNNDNGSAQGIKVRIKSNDSGNFNMLELVSASTGSDVTAMVVRDDGNVGIGTATPAEMLNVESDSASPAILVKAGGQTSSTSPTAELILSPGSLSSNDSACKVIAYRTGDYSSAAVRSNGLKFQTTNANAPVTAMTITNAGNVGIGRSNPLDILHLYDLDDDCVLNLDTAIAGKNSVIKFSDPGAQGRGFIQYAHFDDSFRIHVNGGEKMRINSAGTIKHMSGAGTLEFQALGGSSNLISGSGTVKIKAAGGAVDLIHGSTEVLNTLSDGIYAPNISIGDYLRHSGDTDTSIKFENDHIFFYTGGTRRIMIGDGGNITYGAHAYNAGSGVQTYGSTGRTFWDINYNSYGAEILLVNNRTANGVASVLQYRTNGVVEGSIYGSSTGLAISNVSDYRKKENIRDLTGSLSVIKSLQPRVYEYREGFGTEGDHIGFIAHEIQAHIPKAVTGDKDELYTQTDIDEGASEVIIGDPKYQAVSYTHNEIITRLVQSIQELEARIIALEG